jgi:hypothetical protein
VSLRRLIIEAVRDRLTQIHPDPATGYLTDAGSRVFVGVEPALGPDDPVNAIVVVVGDSIPQIQNAGGLVQETLPLEIQALTRTDVNEPLLDAETLLSDCQRAIEGDLTLGGLVKSKLRLGPTRVLPREPGMTTVGVSVTYAATWVRQLGVVS